MTARLRYTGSWPPPKVLEEYPNWIFALDEENVPGQDETTIKPENQQTYISDETKFTAVSLTFTNGAAQQGILRIEDGRPVNLDGFDGHDWWGLQCASGRWRPIVESWLPMNERRPEINMGDIKAFPILIRSRLANSEGKHFSFTIYQNGDSLADLSIEKRLT